MELLQDFKHSGLRGKTRSRGFITNNILGKPVIFRTHGGRARAMNQEMLKLT